MRTVLHTAEGARLAGIESLLLNLLSGFSRVGGIQVHLAVFSDGPLAERAKKSGVPVHRIERRSKYDTRAIKHLESVIAASGARVVHAHGYLANVVSARACRRKKIPLVTTVHGEPEEFHGWAGLKMAMNMWLDRRTMRRDCARVIAVASFLRDRLAAAGVPPEKLAVVTNGIVDQPPDLALRNANRAELELPPDAPAIAFAGRMDPVKNPLAFVEFAQRLHQQVPQARFIVAGDGPLLAAMHERVLALDLLPEFRFLGHLPMLDAFLSACDLLVLTSRSEGVPLVALEAMRAARPVLAPAVGGLPELIGPLKTLAPANDIAALVELAALLVANRETLATAGQKARERFLSFYTAERMAWETRRIYDAVDPEGM